MEKTRIRFDNRAGDAMNTERPTIVCVTGAAPYLGGPATWRRLRDALPAFDIREIDTLELADSQDIERAFELRLATALEGAVAIVAHGTIARSTVEILARTQYHLPLVLLSPLMIVRSSFLQHVFRTIVGSPLGRRALEAFAMSKYRRLCVDRIFVEKQLLTFVSAAYLTPEILEEAQRRLRDPRSRRVVERTGELLEAIITPVDAAAWTSVSGRCRIFIGSGLMDRKTDRSMGATMLPGVTGAAMIENAEAVAREIDHLILAYSTTEP